MLKILATLCLFSAALLAMQRASAPLKLTKSSSSPLIGGKIKDARPAQRSIEHRNRALKQSQTSKSALHEAAGLTLQPSDRAHWDTAKFATYLHSINKDDAHLLIKELLASDQKGIPLDTSGTAHASYAPSWNILAISNTSSYNSKNAVIAGMLRELSSRDFMGTLSFMTSLPVTHSNRFTEQYFYESILQTGFRQNPEKAWETYVAKCSSPFG